MLKGFSIFIIEDASQGAPSFFTKRREMKASINPYKEKVIPAKYLIGNHIIFFKSDFNQLYN